MALNCQQAVHIELPGTDHLSRISRPPPSTLHQANGILMSMSASLRETCGGSLEDSHMLCPRWPRDPEAVRGVCHV